LNRDYDLRNEAFGYLADVTIAGRTLTALGALVRSDGLVHLCHTAFMDGLAIWRNS
jgi:hypothetical protein